MYYDRKLLKKFYDFVNFERNSGRLKNWKDHVNTFEYFKTKSVDPAIKTFLEPTIDISPKDVQDYSILGQCALSMNVLEAMTQDYKTGHTYNAESAYELALLDGLFDYTSEVNKKRLKINSLGSMYSSTTVPRNWSDLYQSWNMCFVYNQYGDYPLFMAKLLNPAVGNYTDDVSIYMTPRVIALYIHIFRIMTVRTICGISDPLCFKNIDWRVKELSDVWGKVNYIYSKKYRKFYNDLSNDIGGNFLGINNMADKFINLAWTSLKFIVKNSDKERQEEEFINLIEKFRKIKMKKNTDYGLKRNFKIKIKEILNKYCVNNSFLKIDEIFNKLELGLI